MKLIGGRDSIPNGTKFIAFWGDGSGARLFMITDGGELCTAEEGPTGITSPDTWLDDADFVFWMELPDTFKLWFEDREETQP